MPYTPQTHLLALHPASPERTSQPIILIIIIQLTTHQPSNQRIGKGGLPSFIIIAKEGYPPCYTSKGGLPSFRHNTKQVPSQHNHVSRGRSKDRALDTSTKNARIRYVSIFRSYIISILELEIVQPYWTPARRCHQSSYVLSHIIITFFVSRRAGAPQRASAPEPRPCSIMSRCVMTAHVYNPSSCLALAISRARLNHIRLDLSPRFR
jgi:hypothetical protein